MNFLLNKVKNNSNIEKYNVIIAKIGDYIVFNEEDIDCLYTLSNEQLIDIIKIYNSCYPDTINVLLK